MKGLEVTYKDGTKEWYDPVSDFTESDVSFYFFVGGNDYLIYKFERQRYHEALDHELFANKII